MSGIQGNQGRRIVIKERGQLEKDERIEVVKQVRPGGRHSTRVRRQRLRASGTGRDSRRQTPGV